MSKAEGVVSGKGQAEKANRKGNQGGRNNAPASACGAEPPLGRALFRVMRAIMFEETPIPELDALPLAQLRLLWTIHHTPDATMKDFSERLSVSQSTVTQLADRLVRRGLVERHADPGDRRVVRLRVSAAGQAVLGKAQAQQKQTQRAVWEALSAQEQQEAMRGLEVLAHAAEALREAEGRPLPSWPEPPADNARRAETGPEPSQSQPLVDLMARRVRGRAPNH